MELSISDEKLKVLMKEALIEIIKEKKGKSSTKLYWKQ
jgi:hypothetical protein